MIKVLWFTLTMCKIKPITVLPTLEDNNKSARDLEPQIQESPSRTSTVSISLMLTTKILKCWQHGTVTHLQPLKQHVSHSLHSIFQLEALERFKIHCLKMPREHLTHRDYNSYSHSQTTSQKPPQFSLDLLPVHNQIKKLV
jgi:hypothetical protein